ncbi:iron ABC transporter permease [Oscillospiraceae bacterium 38-13]
MAHMHARRPFSPRQPLIYVLATFGLLAVFGLFFLPIYKLAVMAFQVDGKLSLGMFSELLQDTKTLKVIWDTLYINLLSSLFASLIGVIMAYFVAYADIRRKKLIHYALLLPLIIPGYIITLAWMQFFAKSGIVATALRSLVPDMTMPNIYSYWGIIFVFSVTKYPLIYTLTLSTFRKISTDMELAAAVSGCDKVKTFFKVTLPMSFSGIANGLLLVFISCLDNFGTVAFLGIPARITVLSTDIYQTIISFSGSNFSEAAAKSIILGVIGVLSSLVLWRVAKLFQTMQTDLEDMSPRFFLHNKRLLVEVLIWLAIFIINFVPMLTLILTSFMKGVGGGYGLDNMTLSNFAFVFSNPKSFNAIKNSLLLSFSTAGICVVIGTIVAYLMVRRPSRLVRLVENIISVPYSIPGIILGLALILTWASPLPIINKTIYATVFMLLVSYVVRFTSLQIRNSTTGILQMDLSMEEAAEICGAGFWKKWLSVIIPLIFPATLSGMGLVFLNALTELTTSSLLWSAGSETLGVVIYNYTSAGYTTYACALSSVVCLTILALVLLYQGVSIILRRYKGRNTA